MSDPLDCTVVAHTDGYLVVVDGELDLSTAPKLAAILGQFANGTVRVDLTGVRFMDSTGLKTLLVAHRRLRRAGRSMILCGPIDAIIQRTFEITGLDDVLEFEEHEYE